MHIILDTNGLILKKRNKSFYLVSKKERKILSPVRVSTITVAADCLISSAAVQLAIDHAIPIFYTARTGKVYAKLYAKKFVGAEILRTKQVLFQWMPEALEWVKETIRLKAQNQLKVLASLGETVTVEYLENTQRILLSKLDKTRKKSGIIDTQSILTIEAKLGASYWKEYFALFTNSWSVKARSRRPAKDPINAIINYFYGFNYSLVEHSIYLAGLNPCVGLLHKNQYNDPVLTYDLIEPFRPLVDRFVFTLIDQSKVSTTDFTIMTESGTILNQSGKKKIIPLFLEYLESDITIDRITTTYKNHIYRHTDELKQLIKNLDINDFISKL